MSIVDGAEPKSKEWLSKPTKRRRGKTTKWPHMDFVRLQSMTSDHIFILTSDHTWTEFFCYWLNFKPTYVWQVLHKVNDSLWRQYFIKICYFRGLPRTVHKSWILVHVARVGVHKTLVLSGQCGVTTNHGVTTVCSWGGRRWPPTVPDHSCTLCCTSWGFALQKTSSSSTVLCTGIQPGRA